jgi:hypothetical protein
VDRPETGGSSVDDDTSAAENDDSWAFDDSP